MRWDDAFSLFARFTLVFCSCKCAILVTVRNLYCRSITFIRAFETMFLDWKLFLSYRNDQSTLNKAARYFRLSLNWDRIRLRPMRTRIDNHQTSCKTYRIQCIDIWMHRYWSAPAVFRLGSWRNVIIRYFTNIWLLTWWALLNECSNIFPDIFRYSHCLAINCCINTTVSDRRIVNTHDSIIDVVG